MWVVERSDSQHRSSWATRRDAEHYIGVLGVKMPLAHFRFDIVLSNGEHITASMMPG
jgi:hypothetical protein